MTAQSVFTRGTVAPTRQVCHRPVPPWQVKAAEILRVQPATVRAWMETLRKRVAQLLSIMVKWGARDLAEQWMVDFELAFADLPQESPNVVLADISEADSAEDQRRDAYLLDRTDLDCLDKFLASERREVAKKLRGIRMLEAERERLRDGLVQA